MIRRNCAWNSIEELQAAGKRSHQVSDGEMADQIRQIRSYIVEEADGRIGSVCIFQSHGEEAIREHARRAKLPVSEIVPVSNLSVVNPDPS